MFGIFRQDYLGKKMESGSWKPSGPEGLDKFRFLGFWSKWITK